MLGPALVCDHRFQDRAVAEITENLDVHRRGEAHEGREVRNRVRSPVTDQPPRAGRRPDRTGGEPFRIGLRSLRSGGSPGVGPGQKIDTLVGDGHDGRVRIGAHNPGHDGGVHDPERFLSDGQT